MYFQIIRLVYGAGLSIPLSNDELLVAKAIEFPRQKPKLMSLVVRKLGTKLAA